MAELSRNGPAALLDAVRVGAGESPRGIVSVCSAHPAVLQAAFEQALEDGRVALVESTSNQVNQEGGYTGVTPAGFASFVGRLTREAGLPDGRVILGGDHLGPHPWRAKRASVAMDHAAEMVRHYAGAGFEKLHLDASMPCADDPAGPLDETVAAARTAELAAAAEQAASGRPTAPLYVVGTEVPPPGGQPTARGGPAVTRVADAERTLSLMREAFARRGVGRAWERVVALVVQPGVEFGDDVVFPYLRAEAAGLRALAARERLAYEAHSTDYQDEAALRALVEDGFAILKVGPELTFACREATFALEAIERELLGSRGPGTLSGLRQTLDEAMRRDPRHWQAYQGGADEETMRVRRAFGLSDRARYYWPHPEVQAALRRLLANLDGVPLPRGLVSQYLPHAVEDVPAAATPGLPARLVRRHVGRVLRRYARACAPAAVAAPPGVPLR